MTRSHHRVLMAVGAVGAALACRNPAAPAELALAFSAEVPAEPAPLAAAAGDGAIHVLGGYEGAHCGDAEARAARQGTTLRLEVGHFDGERICRRILTGYRYEATLHRLPAGEYTLEVYHRLGSETTLVLRQVVSVD